MDYTVRPWNNLQPGSYNLNLLQTLYGTPTDPLTADVTEGGTIAPPPSTSSPPLRPRPPNRPSDWGGQEDEEEEENEDDRRRRRQLQNKVETLMESCQGTHCVYSISKEYKVVINKLLV
jgi:hypothetical protein